MSTIDRRVAFVPASPHRGSSRVDLTPFRVLCERRQLRMSVRLPRAALIEADSLVRDPRYFKVDGAQLRR